MYAARIFSNDVTGERKNVWRFLQKFLHTCAGCFTKSLWIFSDNFFYKQKTFFSHRFLYIDLKMIFTDQLHREISLEKIPERIVSLVPSQTELLADLGLEKEVIAITKFCIHPEEWFRSKERIGGTKILKLEKIISLHADIIIGNKEENERSQVEQLMQTEKVWMSDIKNLRDACEMIRQVGVLTEKKEKAENIAAEIEKRFAAFREKVKSLPEKRVAYFIWKNPWMAAGHDTFISEMLRECRMKNVFSETQGRYPEITLSELKDAQPEIILLSSEPYPFKEKHIEELQQSCPESKILLVDGEMFSWYGSRLLKSPAYFEKLLQKLTAQKL
jgi:ABC-type Fe3+-hydroxamate transport system substrate-binding protein